MLAKARQAIDVILKGSELKELWQESTEDYTIWIEVMEWLKSQLRKRGARESDETAMTPFERFCSGCKMRHDFSDKIQVRYLHSNGEAYDTWVSGEEALQRLDSKEVEERLHRLSNLDREALRQARDSLPDKVRDHLEEEARGRLSEAVSDWIGGNPIGDALTDAVAGRRRAGEVQDEEKEQWQERLHDPTFRRRVLELAWINLRGSFPAHEEATEDDWV